LPPIQRLETITGWLVLAGFILFTIGLEAGRYLPRPENAGYSQDPKVVWSVFMWVVYLALLVLRRMRVPSNRGFAISVISAFVFLLLTFWGMKQIRAGRLLSLVTCHLSLFPNEHCRHWPEPPFIARGIAGAVCLCRGENSRRAQVSVRIRCRARGRDTLDVQSRGNLHRDRTGTRQGVR